MALERLSSIDVMDHLTISSKTFPCLFIIFSSFKLKSWFLYRFIISFSIKVQFCD